MFLERIEPEYEIFALATFHDLQSVKGQTSLPLCNYRLIRVHSVCFQQKQTLCFFLFFFI